MSETKPLPRDIPEADFGRTFQETAHLLGWKLAHFRPAMTQHGWRTAVSADGAGFPDYFCVHPVRGDRFFAELKTRYQKPSWAQQEWAAWLKAATLEHHFWWPTDWPEIVRRLAP